MDRSDPRRPPPPAPPSPRDTLRPRSSYAGGGRAGNPDPEASWTARPADPTELDAGMRRRKPSLAELEAGNGLGDDPVGELFDLAGLGGD